METTAKIFSIAMPIFLVLVLLEKMYSHWKGKDTVPWMDALASMYSGITFTIRALFGLGISIVSYEFMYENLALFSIQTTWIVYLVTFVVIDFQFYWGHRFYHEINLLWNGHLIHHNSEEYNLATATRQPFFEVINFLFFLTLPSAILGLSPAVIALVLPVHKFTQLWYHTQNIGKLGFLEHIIVTPSQHRVHHAQNPIYMDKNYSAIFNIWDKLFGTFQEELESEPVVYGITRPSQTYNPITSNFEHLILLIKDAWRAEKWMDKLTIWVRPTGWRPEGFDEKYPIKKITNPHNYEKFNPLVTQGLLIWSTIQFIVLATIVIYSLSHFSEIGIEGIIILALFTLMQTYSATELMNRNQNGSTITIITSIISICIYLFADNRFALNRISHLLPFVCIAYFVLQILLSYKFCNQKK